MTGRRDVLGLLLLVASGCERTASGSRDETISLHGAGATFPFPLYSKWIAEYNRQNPSVQINYQSIGSGGGVRQIVARTVDFGATDTPMTADEARDAPSTILHVPTAIGSVVVSYQLPELGQPLRLTSELLARIFLGEIKRWNDPALLAENSGAKLPDGEISVVTRSDGSGTTAIFTDYLKAVSPLWRERVGAGKSVRWPAGLGAKGNEGVTGHLKSTPGAIGYTELAYATQNRLPRAAIKNSAGRFVVPTPDASTAAAVAVPMPESLHVSLADAPSDTAYPIASYTYVLVYANTDDAVKGAALARFLWWATHEGQKFARELDYAPLPSGIVAQVEARLKSLRAGGQPAL
ncbi:MAG TPA: phosphate ABC transporter substrate-binding protein PstS [Polyangiaceae bacterium]